MAIGAIPAWKCRENDRHSTVVIVRAATLGESVLIRVFGYPTQQ
jgi:hypothetical protein